LFLFGRTDESFKQWRRKLLRLTITITIGSRPIAEWIQSFYMRCEVIHGVLTMLAPNWLALAGWSNDMARGLQSAYWYCNEIINFLSVLYSQFICMLPLKNQAYNQHCFAYYNVQVGNFRIQTTSMRKTYKYIRSPEIFSFTKRALLHLDKRGTAIAVVDKVRNWKSAQQIDRARRLLLLMPSWISSIQM
jgi:hypothetical protein